MAAGGTDACGPLPEACLGLVQEDKRLREAQQGRRAPWVDCGGCSHATVFATDDDAGRAALGLKSTDKCCDGAVLFHGPEPTLVFVELKSNQFADADKQLESALTGFRRTAMGRSCRAEVEAVVILSGSTPNKFNSKAKRFRQRTSVSLRVLPGRKKKHRCVQCADLKR